MYKTKKSQFGVSMAEFLMVLALIFVITPLIIYQINLYATRQESQQYADQTIIFTKAFTRYIYNYHGASGKDPLPCDNSRVNIIDFNTLKTAGYLPYGVVEGRYGYPSVSCTLQNGAWNAVMYYTVNDVSDSKYDKKALFAYDAAKAIGAAAGVYNKSINSKVLYGFGGSWSIDLTDSLLDKNLDNTPKNSVIINLNMLPEYSTMVVGSSNSTVHFNNRNGDLAESKNNSIAPSVSSTNSTNSSNSNQSGGTYLYVSHDTNDDSTSSSSKTNQTQTEAVAANKDVGNKLAGKNVGGNLGSGADTYLYRVPDIDHKSGEIANQNTMQTDITIANKPKDDSKDKTISYHGVRFTADSDGPVLISALDQSKSPDRNLVALRNGGLSVDRSLVVQGVAAIRDKAIIDKNLEVGGSAQIAGTATVTGATTIAGATTLKNGLSVSGDTTLNGGADISGDLAVSHAVRANEIKPRATDEYAYHGHCSSVGAMVQGNVANSNGVPLFCVVSKTYCKKYWGDSTCLVPIDELFYVSKSESYKH